MGVLASCMNCISEQDQHGSRCSPNPKFSLVVMVVELSHFSIFSWDILVIKLLLVKDLCCGHQWSGFSGMANQLLSIQIYCVITVCTQLVSTSHVFVTHCLWTVTFLEFKKAFGLNSHLLAVFTWFSAFRVFILHCPPLIGLTSTAFIMDKRLCFGIPLGNSCMDSCSFRPTVHCVTHLLV